MSSSGGTYLETYAPISGGEAYLTLSSVLGASTQLAVYYELRPGELTVSFTDLPEGAPGEVTLIPMDASGTNNPPLDQIPPGTNIIRGASYETTEVFYDQNGNPQDLYIRYETNFTAVAIGSGVNPELTFQYAAVDGIIRLGILSATHLPADTEIIGNVTFTHLRDGHTYTLIEQTIDSPASNLRHNLEAPPGVYQIEIQRVAPRSGEHNGFEPYPAPQVLYRNLASPNPSDTGNDVTLDARYTPNPMP